MNNIWSFLCKNCLFFLNINSRYTRKRKNFGRMRDPAQVFATHPDTQERDRCSVSRSLCDLREEGQYARGEKVTFWTWGQSCALPGKEGLSLSARASQPHHSVVVGEVQRDRRDQMSSLEQGLASFSKLFPWS